MNSNDNNGPPAAMASPNRAVMRTVHNQTPTTSSRVALAGTNNNGVTKTPMSTLTTRSRASPRTPSVRSPYVRITNNGVAGAPFSPFATAGASLGTAPTTPLQLARANNDGVTETPMSARSENEFRFNLWSRGIVRSDLQMQKSLSVLSKNNDNVVELTKEGIRQKDRLFSSLERGIVQNYPPEEIDAPPPETPGGRGNNEATFASPTSLDFAPATLDFTSTATGAPSMGVLGIQQAPAPAPTGNSFGGNTLGATPSNVATSTGVSGTLKPPPPPAASMPGATQPNVATLTGTGSTLKPPPSFGGNNNSLPSPAVNMVGVTQPSVNTTGTTFIFGTTAVTTQPTPANISGPNITGHTFIFGTTAVTTQPTSANISGPNITGPTFISGTIPIPTQPTPANFSGPNAVGRFTKNGKRVRIEVEPAGTAPASSSSFGTAPTTSTTSKFSLSPATVTDKDGKETFSFGIVGTDPNTGPFNFETVPAAATSTPAKKKSKKRGRIEVLTVTGDSDEENNSPVRSKRGKRN